MIETELMLPYLHVIKLYYSTRHGLDHGPVLPHKIAFFREKATLARLEFSI
mgnify:CR=1 FL=1